MPILPPDAVGGAGGAAAPSAFLGTYISLAALQAAHPTASAGEYADVDAGPGTDAQRYIWDADEGWVVGAGGPTSAAGITEVADGNVQVAIDNLRANKLESGDTLTDALFVIPEGIVNFGMVFPDVVDLGPFQYLTPPAIGFYVPTLNYQETFIKNDAKGFVAQKLRISAAGGTEPTTSFDFYSEVGAGTVTHINFCSDPECTLPLSQAQWDEIQPICAVGGALVWAEIVENATQNLDQPSALTGKYYVDQQIANISGNARMQTKSIGILVNSNTGNVLLPATPVNASALVPFDTQNTPLVGFTIAGNRVTADAGMIGTYALFSDFTLEDNANTADKRVHVSVAIRRERAGVLENVANKDFYFRNLSTAKQSRATLSTPIIDIQGGDIFDIQYIVTGVDTQVAPSIKLLPGHRLAFVEKEIVGVLVDDKWGSVPGGINYAGGFVSIGGELIHNNQLVAIDNTSQSVPQVTAANSLTTAGVVLTFPAISNDFYSVSATGEQTILKEIDKTSAELEIHFNKTGGATDEILLWTENSIDAGVTWLFTSDSLRRQAIDIDGSGIKIFELSSTGNIATGTMFRVKVARVSATGTLDIQKGADFALTDITMTSFAKKLTLR